MSDYRRGELGNPEEEERPPLEAANKQRLSKTKKNFICAVVAVVSDIKVATSTEGV
jgi:hypothetical protein